MARSATNKAKAKTKKAERAAPRPKAQINARAKLMNVKSVAGEKSGYGDNQKQETCVELTLRVSMGAPAHIRSWADYKGGDYSRSRHIREALDKLKPARPKEKKGEAQAPTMAEKFDEAAELKRLGQEYDAQLRAKYEKECEKVNRANLQFMERAAAFAMFMALRGQDVQLSLSPVQQGFKELFGGSQAQLGSGQPDDADPSDDETDEYGDDGE